MISGRDDNMSLAKWKEREREERKKDIIKAARNLLAEKKL